jgi:16S rRNA (guanine527-N7)-methyltransferase
VPGPPFTLKKIALSEDKALNVLVELMLPSVKLGGICICMKGNNADTEIKEAEKAIKELGGEIIKVERIVLPKLDLERNIIIIKKVKQTPNKYPRKPGTPQKEPIK